MFHSCHFLLSKLTTFHKSPFFFGYMTHTYSYVTPCTWFPHKWLKFIVVENIGRFSGTVPISQISCSSWFMFCNCIANYLPYQLRFGSGTQQELCYKAAQSDFWYLLLFGSDDLLQKFEALIAIFDSCFVWK